MADLESRVQREGATDRDIAIFFDITQRYLDGLDALLESDLSVDASVMVQVDGATVKFPNDDSLASWIMQGMNK